VKKGKDIAVEFPGLYLVHHNLPEKKVEKHSHPKEHILFIPLQGEITVLLDDKTLKAGPGKMIYLPADTHHAFDSSSLLGERVIALIQSTPWKKAKGSRTVPSVIATNQLCKELLFYLLLHPKTPAANVLIQTLIVTLSEALEASCHLLDPEHLSGKTNDPRIAKAIQFFIENLSEKISMDHAAKAAGLSTRNLTRLFAQTLELSPKQVLTQCRIHHARTLLLSGSNVTDAAFAVGYQSLSQFIQSFRELTGFLPSEVRRGI
jgi:AraC-like DNA-binding protein/mannose-6-phosphate isomerase-like protein (cupin superfamily)